jgi:succinate dehydrogenase / fumarate reductase cytochrome b subunit
MMRLSDPTHHTLRRLHSLTGVVPVGVFLLEHFFTNSHAVEGRQKFDDAAAFLGGLPYVTFIEAFGIWLPILFHMVLGVVIATSWQSNTGRHGYPRNWHYVLQRVSGLFLVVYIIFHTWSTRFSAAAMSAPSLYDYMARELSHPGMFAFYVAGVVSASYHFGNGLFGFAIHWGLASGRRAQQRVGALGLAVALVLALVGINSMLGFLGRGINPFPKMHAAEVTVAVPGER